mgnify:CR=1 FL=1
MREAGLLVGAAGPVVRTNWPSRWRGRRRRRSSALVCKGPSAGIIFSTYTVVSRALSDAAWSPTDEVSDGIAPSEHSRLWDGSRIRCSQLLQRASRPCRSDAWASSGGVVSGGWEGRGAATRAAVAVKR